MGKPMEVPSYSRMPDKMERIDKLAKKATTGFWSFEDDDSEDDNDSSSLGDLMRDNTAYPTKVVLLPMGQSYPPAPFKQPCERAAWKSFLLPTVVDRSHKRYDIRYEPLI
jgi:hypothetical protein